MSALRMDLPGWTYPAPLFDLDIKFGRDKAPFLASRALSRSNQFSALGVHPGSDSTAVASGTTPVFSWAKGVGLPATTSNCTPNTRWSNCAWTPVTRSACAGSLSHYAGAEEVVSLQPAAPCNTVLPRSWKNCVSRLTPATTKGGYLCKVPYLCFDPTLPAHLRKLF
jgi:hypothetical protein